MKDNKKGIYVILIIVLIIAVVVYFVFFRKGKPLIDIPQLINGGSSSNDNFKQLQANLGIKASGNRLTVKFNEAKNQADYYDNSRVVISTIGISGYLKKGSYSDGGKIITLDNGKQIIMPTAWATLEQTLV